MDTTLIEGPSGKLGRINRDLNMIQGATLIGPLSSNGPNKKRRYSEKALKQIAEQAEGLPGYLNHVKPEDAFKPRDVRDIAVRHHNVRFDPTTQSVRSDMYIMPNHADLVFALAENFGDHIGNSLVSKGAVAMEGDTEVVNEIFQLRSADIVSDPASTKGLFEGSASGEGTLLDLIELVKEREQKPDARVVALAESRWTRRPGAALPEGIHERVASLMEASKYPSPRSEVKKDMQPTDILDRAVAMAVANYKTARKPPAPAPPRDQGTTLLRESLDDLRRKYPDATPTELAYALFSS